MAGPRARMLILAALTLLALAGVAGAGAPAHAKLRLGLNADPFDTTANRADVRHIRHDLLWRPVQPRRGVFRWRTSDADVTQAARKGLTLLPVLLGGPRWVGPWNRVPSDPRSYATWVARLATRYGPGGSFWRKHRSLPYRPLRHFELWNEPYLDFFSAGGVNPARYARLVRATVRAGRAANRHVRFLLQADWTPGEPRKSFIDGMYAAVPDLNAHFDVVAVHPYSPGRAPDRPGDPWGFQRLADIRARFLAHGAADKPLWITEVGWSTCPASSEGCVSERRQATYLRRVHRLIRERHPYVRALYVYNGRDSPSQRRYDREGWFGLVRPDGSRKPALKAVRKTVRLERR